MSDPQRIGIPDGTPAPRPTHCAGASLMVDLAGYRALERGGVRWATRTSELPAEGKGNARVACDGQERRDKVGTQTYTYAVCADCAALERRFRSALMSGGT